MLTEVDRRRAVQWAADPCVCGHTRAGHMLRPRQPWPATLRRYGRCTECACAQLGLDAEQIEARETALRAERRASFDLYRPVSYYPSR